MKNSYTLFRQESINLDLKAFKLSDTLDAKSIRTYEVADGIKSFKIEHTAIVPKEDKIELEKKTYGIQIPLLHQKVLL